MDGDVSKDRFGLALIWIASIAALGVLGIGIYAVFNSANASGTAALLVIGPLALFVILFRDRISSMQLGGAKMKLAVRVKDSLKRAFDFRLAGNYEQAEHEIEDAFDQFVSHAKRSIRDAYYTSKIYQGEVLKKLGDYVRGELEGTVSRTSSTVSFLPLIDAVMTLNEEPVKKLLRDHGKEWCAPLNERLDKEKISALPLLCGRVRN